MAEFPLLEEDAVTRILHEPEGGDVTGRIDAENALAGNFFTLGSANTVTSAALLRFPVRTFVMSFGFPGSYQNETFLSLRNNIYMEAGTRSKLPLELIPEFVEIWTPAELETIEGAEDAVVEADAIAKLTALGYVEAEDQFLLFGPFTVLLNLHKAIQTLVSTDYKAIRDQKLFEPEAMI